MSPRKNPPMFHVGGLSGAILCVTRWTTHGGNRFTAIEQFDVTEEVEEAVRLRQEWLKDAGKDEPAATQREEAGT